MKKIILTLFIILFLSGAGWASEQTASDAPPESTPPEQQTTEPDTSSVSEDTSGSDTETATASTDMEEEKPDHGIGHKLLFYIPNRFLDVFDFVRLRLRVGPGFALGGRVTKPISFFFGGYSSVYIGLPGPRLKPIVKLPVGIENYGGLSLSLLDSTNEGKFAPNYSNTEIGYSLQLLIVGADVDVDPVEVIDLVLGFLFIDIRGDDL
jgi:hypothetical protein